MKVNNTPVLRRFGRVRSEKGMSTAEYAIGTLGACTIGGVLAKIGSSEWFGNLIQQVLTKILDALPF